jgi:hypothetical protein
MANPHEPPDDISRLTDAGLLKAYERTSGTLGDLQVDALVAEINRRILGG